jgi:ParB family transcriptional regulator, chromosome partitioning protein
VFRRIIQICPYCRGTVVAKIKLPLWFRLGRLRKGEIARSISKSPAFVTLHVTLLDLPDPIAGVFNSGRVKDVTVVNELVTAFKKKPEEVAGWLSDENQEITRGAVMLLREFLDDKLKHERFGDEGDDGEGGISGIQDNQEIKGNGVRLEDPARLKKAIVKVRHNRRSARLILSRRPSTEGLAWLQYMDDGQEVEVDLVHVKLEALLEG